MSRYEKAKKFMQEDGFACSQAVVEVFSEDLGMDRLTARKMSACFGGGMKSAEVCGLATGGVMVLGMKFAQTEAGDMATKKASGPITREFLERFKVACSGYTCEDLLGVNITTPEGAAFSEKHNLHKERCPECLEATIKILENMVL